MFKNKNDIGMSTVKKSVHMTTVPSVALKVIQMTTIAPSVVLIKSRDESRCYYLQYMANR